MKRMNKKNSMPIVLILLVIGLTSWTVKENTILNLNEDSVSVVNVENGYKAGQTMTFEVDYVAKKDRDVAIEVREDGKWIGGKTVKVEKGAGKENITIKFKNAPLAGSNHIIKVNIRPVGTTWKEALGGNTYKDVLFN